MIPDWEQFSDPMNMVSKPSQMGPMWLDAKYLTGAEIDANLWVTDPPASSFPACLAVKTAALQSERIGAALLHALQRAVMTQGVNIAKKENLILVAKALAAQNEGFDYARFQNDYNNGASREAFRADLRAVKLNGISRFPTLTMTRVGQPGVMITGYRPYEVLLEAFAQVAPELFVKSVL